MIGEGAYGKVFKARCNKTLEKVAIKYIDLETAKEARFIVATREIKILSFLTKLSTNIFTLKLIDLYFPKETNVEDFDSIKGVYLVTEYVKCDLFVSLTKSESKYTRK